MIKTMNKKGFVGLYLIGFIALSLIAIYIVLFLPIPAFTKLRQEINYFIILAVWIIIQVGFVFAYVEIGRFATKNFKGIKNKLTRISVNVHRYIVMHS